MSADPNRDGIFASCPKLALFCSIKCPGKLILNTYDLAKKLRQEGITVISGFHSPMEKECLRILLRSQNPVFWCLAHGKMFPKDYLKKHDEEHYHQRDSIANIVLARSSGLLLAFT